MEILIAGGGYIGMYTAGRLELRWVLVEATGWILPELDERLGQWTLRALRRRGVDDFHDAFRAA
jgi:NADH dehydrogenase FAD-containing subunit